MTKQINVLCKIFPSLLIIANTTFAATLVDSEVTLNQAIESNSDINLSSDITVSHPIYLKPNQVFDGHNHKIQFNDNVNPKEFARTNITANPCLMNLNSNDQLQNATIISTKDGVDTVCAINIHGESVHNSNLTSTGQNSSAFTARSTSVTNFFLNVVNKSGSGWAANIGQDGSNDSLYMTNNNFYSSSSQSAVVFIANTNSFFQYNYVQITYGAPQTPTIAGFVGAQENNLKIDSNLFEVNTQGANAIRLTNGNGYIVTNNKFLIGPTNPYISIGIFLGNDNDQKEIFSDLLIANNDFTLFTKGLVSAGYYQAALYVVGTTILTFDTKSTGNIIGVGKNYGSSQLGAQIYNAVTFTDGTTFPTNPQPAPPGL